MPWPDYFTVGDNIRFFRQQGVTGVYQEGQCECNGHRPSYPVCLPDPSRWTDKAYGGDMQELKSWLGQKLSECSNGRRGL